MNNHFFDLEDTIIDSWQNQTLVNVHKVRKYISDNNIKDVVIFSAAVWNDKDKNQLSVTL